jgi:hypothetical protein
VTAITALAVMLWQYAHPVDSLRSLYEEDPRLAHAVVDFVPRLASMPQNLITGMLVHSQAEAAAKTGKQDPKRGITCGTPHQALVGQERLSLAI